MQRCLEGQHLLVEEEGRRHLEDLGRSFEASATHPATVGRFGVDVTWLPQAPT